jgi:hypothetical protein
MWTRWRTTLTAHVRQLAEAEQPGAARGVGGDLLSGRSPLLPLLRAASGFVHCAATVRAWLYDSRLLPVHRSGIPCRRFSSPTHGVVVLCVSRRGRINGWCVAMVEVPLSTAARGGAGRRVGAPVISVGNVTWGGTGKTPMVEHLTRICLQHGTVPVILSRVRRSHPRSARELTAASPR